MLHVYTGNGKGKTTAALGLILRSLGHQRHICLIQFMKKNCTYGEITFLSTQPNIKIFQFGTPNFVDKNNPAPIDCQEAQSAIKKTASVLTSHKYDLVVVDEINVALYFGLISLEQVLALIPECKHQEVVFTGRYAHAQVIAHADLVTEMREIKHYYQANVPARQGVEF